MTTRPMPAGPPRASGDRRTVAVVTAGLREPSTTRLLADRLASATTAALETRGVAADVVVVEVREHAHAMTNMLLTGFAEPALRAALDSVADADGLVAVTPVFSGAYSGMFKTFFDLTEDGALRGVPTLLAATAGTPRHSLALEHSVRPLMAYLGALTVPTAVFGATADFGATSDLAARVERAAEELADLVASRSRRERLDPFALGETMADLLR